MNRTRIFLLTPLAWASLAALAQTAALPTGGVVTQGSGSISSNGSAMVVQQDSARMVADWQSFSIGAGNSVRFVQPSSDSVALNRVIGGDPSAIFGSLTANGHVYLQNPNGVLFAPGAQVNVGALVATTLNADVGQFMAGHLRLAGTGGAVRNEGSLQAAPGGYVVLAAPQVSNAGSIAAPGGTAALAAGSAVEIDPTGSGLLSIRVPVAAVAARLENSGHIGADGGLVALQAAATDAALNTVMQVGGVVRARSIEQRDGQILLSGGSSGVVRVDGTLDASGAAGLAGGTVKVLGERVGLMDGARIDASGGSGGGTVLVGGNFQGKGPEANAQVTVVAAQASIDASARDSGDGGRVIVWADQATSFQGSLAARGGASAGDGGFAEVSGKQHLDFRGAADLSAPGGTRGTLLLDPDTLIIGTVADLNGDNTPGDDLGAADLPLLAGDFAGSSFPSQITAAQVATLLATTDVSLQAGSSMTVSAPLTVAAGGAATTLSMEAPIVNINDAMTLNNTALVVDTAQDFSDSILVTAPVQSLSSISLTSTDIFLDDATLTAPSVTLTSRANSFGPSTIGQTGPSGVIADTLTIGRLAGATSSVVLDGNQNQVSALDLDVDSAQVIVTNAAGVGLLVSGTADSLDLTANTGVAQNAGAGGALAVADFFSLTTSATDPVSGAVNLTNPANSFGGSGLNFNVASNLNVNAAGDFAASGTAGRNITLVATGLFSMNSSIVSTGTGGAANIDISGAGFVDNSDGGAITPPAGGRYFIRSSDFTQDSFFFGFGAGATEINHVVLADWTGADPATGNVYFTNATGTLTADPAEVSDVSRVYDGTTTFAYTQTGTGGTGVVDFNIDNFFPVSYNLTSTGDFADKNAGADKAYTVAATGDVVATASTGEIYYGMNFAGFSRAAGAGTAVSEVTPRAITSTGITAVDRVYDGTTTVALDTAGVLLDNAVAGDDLSLAAATGSMSDKNVGVDKPVAIAGLTLAGADAGNYTVTDASNATVTITPAAISLTGLVAVDRAYDGTTSVAINTDSDALTGVISGDTVGVTGATGTMADKNVGTAKPVTISAVTLAGADAGNYTVTDANSVTVNIDPALIFAAGISGVDRPYDGTVDVALDLSAATLSGAVAGDDVSLVTSGVGGGTMSDKNVGTDKPVTVTGLSLGGTDAVNYDLVVGSFPITVDITPLEIAVAGLKAQNRVVDGTTLITLDTSGAELQGVVSGDEVVLDPSGAVGSVETPDPGLAKPVSVSGLLLNGADAANYSVLATPVTPSGEGLTVRILTVAQGAFEDVRFTRYLQGVSDAQEPFRRAMAEALAAGFGKENIRKQLSRGLVFETGLAAPAVDNIDSAKRPEACTGGAALGCR